MQPSPQFQELLNHTQAVLANQVPVPEDEIAYQAAYSIWAEEYARAGVEITRLVAEGQKVQAYALLQKINRTKPKLKKGRPKRNLPPVNQIRYTLAMALAEEGIAKFTKAKLDDIVERVVVSLATKPSATTEG